MSTPATLRMEPELTIYSAAQVRQVLLDAFGESASIVLDLTDVCEIDSAGVQLLLAARRHADTHGCVLQLLGHSATVLDAFALLGIDAQCGALANQVN